MKISKQLFYVAIVSAILSERFSAMLSIHIQARSQSHLEQSTSEIIGLWTLEFYHKHKNTHWDEALAKGLLPLSNQVFEIICFYDAVIDFGFSKLNQFK